MKNIYFIDFENVQSFSYESLDKDRDMVVIFVGHAQSKISFDVVNRTQRLGDSVRWIKMAGSGRNALDFHIAYYLGFFNSAQEELGGDHKVYIVSNDGDYDVLIKHIQESGFSCERIGVRKEVKCEEQVSIKGAVEPAKKDSHVDSIVKFKSSVEVFDHLVSTLRKQEKLKRPRTAGTLKNHVVAHYQKKTEGLLVDKVLDLLVANKKILVKDGRISYLF